MGGNNMNIFSHFSWYGNTPYSIALVSLIQASGIWAYGNFQSYYMTQVSIKKDWLLISFTVLYNYFYLLFSVDKGKDWIEISNLPVKRRGKVTTRQKPLLGVMRTPSYFPLKTRNKSLIRSDENEKTSTKW